MGATALLITSATISLPEFVAFVDSLGGQLVPHEQTNFVIGDEDTDVWVGIEPDEIIGNNFSPESIDEWRHALGNEPRMSLEIRLDHGSKRKELYLYVAYMFSKRWPMVLDDIDETVVTAAALEKRYHDTCKHLTIDKG